MPPKARRVIGAKRRFKVLEGGRGSAKSYSFADALADIGWQTKVRALCTREMQNSIKDSVHKLLCDRIEALNLKGYYITEKSIRHTGTGSEFIFKGLRHNIKEIKSTEGIDICWVEEAENVSEQSWDILTPTIRKPNSQIWISFNQEDENSATHKMFITNPSPDVIRAHMTFRDNKFFPDVLRAQMEYTKRVDYDKYLHIWEGEVKKYANTLIFQNVVVEEFEEPPEGTQFFFGSDWGFSVDPTVLVRCFIIAQTLYIDYEFYKVGCEITDLHGSFDTVPRSHDWIIRGDNERPDTISHLKKNFVDRSGNQWSGFNIVSCEKGKGSVEDGIQFLRSFERIVIHPRCKGSAGDFKNYRWKVDKVSGDILPIPQEGSDHAPDAVRYALEKYIKAKEPNIRFL